MWRCGDVGMWGCTNVPMCQWLVWKSWGKDFLDGLDGGACVTGFYVGD
jgi:hypothetical protein